MDREDEIDCEFEMENPNLYLTLSPSGGIWSANTYTWQETNPWTLNSSN